METLTTLLQVIACLYVGTLLLSGMNAVYLKYKYRGLTYHEVNVRLEDSYRFLQAMYYLRKQLVATFIILGIIKILIFLLSRESF